MHVDMESSDISPEHLTTSGSTADADCGLDKGPGRCSMWLTSLLLVVLLVTGVLFICINFSSGTFPKDERAEREIEQLQARIQWLMETLQNITKDTRCHLCPQTWHWFWGHCYFLSVGLEEDLKWTQSAQYCRTHNASLGIIRNKSEMEFILGLMRTRSEKPFPWIGLSYSQNEGQWVWEDGTPLHKHTFIEMQWESEQRDCADLRGDGTVFACNCESYGPWLCKKPVEPVASVSMTT
ncbi:natural killer cells antigen CD94-like [Brachyhypopomus gauderio]|uniref:natural killer cells antigen CD94-like n=1 Tax=Brachyhypopomus gauderio TaxID=698409 RepID=UPI0040428537